MECLTIYSNEVEGKIDLLCDRRRCVKSI